MRVGIVTDHGEVALKGEPAEYLRAAGVKTVDFGADKLNRSDDYPKFIIPLRTVAAREVERAVTLCESGVRDVCAARATMCSLPNRALKMTT